MLDFAGAAAQPFDLEDTAEEFRGSLALAKAWGLVMTQRPQEAEPLFELAAVRQRQGDARFELYLLNIRALNQLRLGKFDAAFALEARIQQSLQERVQPDWQLAYVNAINLARLQRIRRDHARAREQYLRAFAINAGLRSQSDLPQTGTLLLDEQFGVERPVDGAQLLQTAVRLNCREVLFADHAVTLSEPQRQEIEQRSMARASAWVWMVCCSGWTRWFSRSAGILLRRSSPAPRRRSCR